MEVVLLAWRAATVLAENEDPNCSVSCTFPLGIRNITYLTQQKLADPAAPRLLFFVTAGELQYVGL